MAGKESKDLITAKLMPSSSSVLLTSSYSLIASSAEAFDSFTIFAETSSIEVARRSTLFTLASESFGYSLPGITGGWTGWAQPLSSSSERADESVTMGGRAKLIASAATSPKHSRSEGRTTTLQEL